MKIAIISPYRTVAPHFEAELEIAQQHLDAGDEVVFLSCEGQLANCDFNVDRDPSICANCRGRREHGMELLDRNCATYQIDASNFIAIPQFESMQHLMDWKVENFDVGYAALSSLVSVVRDPEPDLEKHAALLNRFIESALATWQQTLEFIKQHRPDRIYVYNGRFAAMRAIFRASQKLGVACFLHERGCDLNHYDLLENHLPHDLVGIENVIRQLWDRADSDKRGAVGASWFEDRISKVERSWKSFTKEQQAGLLPENLEPAARNISIFCSSDDEFVAIGDAWKNELYPNQVEAIAAIAESMLQSAPETRLFLRVHPNLKDVDNARKRSMMALDYSNLTVIAPEASIDTYALLKASDQTVTFGSSVGMEAVFWDRPSVLLGPCLYQNLGGPIRSHSHQQTIELLCSDLQPASDKTGALMYGNWFQSRGIRYQYFEAKDLFEGTFKGQVVHDREAARAESRKYRGLMSLFR
ncbi:capsular polysaccharide export protein, LipB/KpsS family [Mariniblastus fucicola]|uniref:Capsule polysaccharide biosynthesis protein n=1 Tax=Mariniblastus fucicola TaxID=980251 RepID=A0A5B9PLE7_9BACT|nr:hypothetical protein [Mariniblastus fucicola]QEG23501.1 Capsule polysaccharide biosynthesis protein [Mariniblastus fucicola]